MEPTGQQWKPNLYAAALSKVSDQVQDLLHDVGAAGGTPLRFVTADIIESWTATGSQVRTAFLTDLHDADAGWRAALASLGGRAHGEAVDEDPWIDVENDPRQAWKTHQMRVAPTSRGRAV